MNEPSLLDNLSEEAVWRLEEVCCRFEKSWLAGAAPRPEDFVNGAVGDERLAVVRELVRLDVYYRDRFGQRGCAQEYAKRFPDAASVLSEMFARSADGRAALAIGGAQNTIPEAERTGPHKEAEKPAGADGQSTAQSGPLSDASAVSRFRVLRFHAAGALGEVSVAEDVELHREVALKEIKRAYASQGERRERFVLEAEITGNLEHPGIVPVYGLGTYPDGRPYYAMRFIRGETLAAAIERFHAGRSGLPSRTGPARQAGPTFDSLEFRQLLGRLVAVCQAIGYAHNRGVLHRDIKPGNIMLGKFGETLVVDWGLAKVVGRPAVAMASRHAEESLHPMVGGAQSTVGVVGTPAFMSPEQAAGKVEELTAATDVYSLGATLYALLTNRPPFTGEVLEVLKQVESGAWTPACDVITALPAALDAVCRKAMALRPENRYASALALAEDLENWLGDEPLTAYPESAGARLRRRMRKRPRTVTAAVVLLLATVVGLTAGSVLLGIANQKANKNLAMVERQVKYFVHEVSGDLLLIEPGMQELRQRMLLRVLEDYEDFLKQSPGDPHARQQMADAKRQLAELYLQMGKMGGTREARVLAQESVNLYEGLLRETPTDRGSQFGLARAWCAVAGMHLQLDAPGEERSAADRSIELLEAVQAAQPGNGEFLLALARSYDLRATAEGRLGNMESGLEANHRALKILVEKCPGIRLGDSPNRFWGDTHLIRRPRVTTRSGERGTTGNWSDMEWPILLLLGRACTNRGVLLSMSGRNAEAAHMLDLAIMVFHRLRKLNSRASPFRHGLALALLHSGRVTVQLGLPRRAESNLSEAVRLMDQLVQDDPRVAEYRGTRLVAVGYLGMSLFRQGRIAAAAKLLREVERKGEEVLGGPDSNHGLRGQHAYLLHVLGCLETESGNLARGFVACRKAQEKLEQLLRDTPGLRSLCSEWITNREALARCRFLKGELTRVGWIAEQQAILDERKNLVRHGPPSPGLWGEVIMSATVLADLLLEAGRPAESLSCIEDVLSAHEKIVRAEQERMKAVPKEYQDANQLPFTPHQALSLELFMRKTSMVPDTSLDRERALLLLCRGAALSHVAGRQEDAVKAVRQSIVFTRRLFRGDGPVFRSPRSPGSLSMDVSAWFWRPEPSYLYDLACRLALVSTLPGAHSRPGPQVQAVACLHCLVAAGFDNLYKLRSDPALEPLRKREDLKNLIHDLESRDQAQDNIPDNR